MAKQIELVSAWKLPSVFPTLSYKEILVSPEITKFLSVTLFQTAEISRPRADRVGNETRRRSSLLTTLATVDASWLDARSLLHTVVVAVF